MELLTKACRIYKGEFLPEGSAGVRHQYRVSNVIRLHLDGDMPVDADLDLSDVFKDFTADGISVDITVRVSPSLHTASASIEDWQNVEWGQGIITY